MASNFTSRPLKSGDSKNSNNKTRHRKTSSNPFGSKSRRKSKAEKYSSYEQEEEGSSIFHQLDPSSFPLTKLDSLWMDSAESDKCCICFEKIDSKLFGTKKRHCKKCGRVVCIPCSDIRIRKHRVCDQCHAYYLTLNNILNLWYRTNRNINHSLCGYDSYTLDTCASLKRILFILNHYHDWLLLKRDGSLSLKRERQSSKIAQEQQIPIKNKRAKCKPPFNIQHVSMKQFVNRLPKYNSETFLSDIHHLKQTHFKNKQIFKISQYQKNHQWELRAYSWKKIGKCDRWGCQYGIKDERKSDRKKKSSDNDKDNDDEKKEDEKNQKNHKRNQSVTLDSDVPTLLNNMHVILLHGVDEGDKEKEDSIERAKELYDLLPQTPLSPHMGFFSPNLTKKKSSEETGVPKVELEVIEAEENALTPQQEAIISIDVAPLSEIEWMDERHQTLCHWLDVCCARFDFFSTNQNEWEAIQKKKQILSDILDYLDMTDHIWDDEIILKSIMKMLKKNLFRSLPLTFRMLLDTPDYCQEDDGDEFEDPHYPHLCYVYEIALMFVRNINVDDRQRKKYLGKSFIIPLTELFASEDVREREYLKAILHGIYARNMRLRRLIRQQMSNSCFRVIYGDDRTEDIENGISECLQLVCSIIQGLTTPIKQEYKNILYNVLIPLHKANSRKLHKFHETLLACCIQFILKDLTIGLDILSGLLKYWPHQSAAKSDMFLKEIVIIINTMMTDIDGDQHDSDNEDDDSKPKKDKNIFRTDNYAHTVSYKIIDKLIECMVSENHCLSEKALLAFGEVGVQKLIDLDKKTLWPKILNILFDNRDNKRHWCTPLYDSFDEALDTFVIRDAKSVQYYEKLWKQQKKPNQFTKDIIYYGTLSTQNKPNKQRQNKWKTIEVMAHKNKPKSTTATTAINGHSQKTQINGHKPTKPLPKPPKKKINHKKVPSGPPTKPLPKNENFV